MAEFGQKRKLLTLSDNERSGMLCASGILELLTDTVTISLKQGKGFGAEITCIDINSYTDPAGPNNRC